MPDLACAYLAGAPTVFLSAPQQTTLVEEYETSESSAPVPVRLLNKYVNN